MRINSDVARYPAPWGKKHSSCTFRQQIVQSLKWKISAKIRM